jgi:outer membrane receptor protein involved in Fe transport
MPRNEAPCFRDSALAGGRREGGGRHSGPRPQRLSGFPPTDAYNLVNLYVGYQPTPDVLASFGIDNLFNQHYVQYMNAEGQSAPGQAPAFIFPSPGITFKGGLKIRFGA